MPDDLVISIHEKLKASWGQELFVDAQNVGQASGGA